MPCPPCLPCLPCLRQLDGPVGDSCQQPPLPPCLPCPVHGVIACGRDWVLVLALCSAWTRAPLSRCAPRGASPCLPSHPLPPLPPPHTRNLHLTGTPRHAVQISRRDSAFTATLTQLTAVEGVAQAKVSWDDGDSQNRDLVLTGEAAVPWRLSPTADAPLLLRLCGKQKAQAAYSAFMKSDAHSVKVTVPDAAAVPRGVFNLVLSTTCMKNQKLASGLAGGYVVLSSQLGEEESQATRTIPRALDFYSTTAAGAVKDLYLSLGIATPLDPHSGNPEPKKAFVLGLQVAIVKPDRGGGAEKKVEVRDAGKGITATQEPPVVAHALAESGLLMRRSQETSEVALVLGSVAFSIRKMITRSEIFSVLNEAELLAGGNVFSFLTSLPTYRPRGNRAVGELMEGICAAGAHSLRLELELASREQAGACVGVGSARTHTRTHARMHARTHARTRAHTRAHARTLPLPCPAWKASTLRRREQRRWKSTWPASSSSSQLPRL